MRTGGLIGGMSWPSSERYYHELNRRAGQILGQSHSFRLVMWSVDFQEHLEIHERRGWEGVRAEIMDIAQRLKLAGAELLALCVNTLHPFDDGLEDETGPGDGMMNR